MTIEKALLRLGLTANERKVYLALLEKRRATPAEIGRITRVNRTTVYSLLKNLAGRGLIAEDLANKKKVFVLVPPQKAERLIQGEERELKQKEQAVRDLTRALTLASVGAEYQVPKIRFVEESDIEEHLRARTPTWNKSMQERDGIWWGFQDHTFVERYRKWIDWYWARAPKAIALRLLSNKSQIEEKMKGRHARRAIKFWQKGGNFTATVWIVGNYVVLVNTQTKPFYLVEIHDAALAHNMREVFKNLWGMV